MGELINGRWRVRRLWSQPKSPCYYGVVVDTRTGKESRFSTGIEMPRDGVKDSTRKRIESKARQAVQDWIAEREQREKEDERRQREPEAVLFEAAFEEWLGGLGIRERTRKDYEHDRDAALSPLFTGRLVCDITPRDVDKLRARFKDRSRRTRQKYIGRLRQFMTWAVRVGYAESDPTVGVKAGGQKKERTRIALTPSQARKLLEACREEVVIDVGPDPKRKRKKDGWRQRHKPPESLHLATAIALYTGLRPPGTVEALCWTHIDFKGGRIALPPGLIKTETAIEIPLHPSLARLLKGALSNNKDVKPGEPVVGRIGNFRRNLQGASKRCGLAKELEDDPLKNRDVTPYDLRRTFATWIEIEAGAPRSIVKRLMGHTLGDDVTDLYVNPSWDKCVAAVEALPDVLRAPRSKAEKHSASSP